MCKASILQTLPVLFISAAALAPNAAERRRSRPRALDLLLAQKYTELTGMLAPSAKETLTPAFLRDRAGTEIQGFGKLGTIGEPVTARDDKYTLVSFPVQFSKVGVNIQFTLTESGQVAGIHFRPANAPLPPVWHRPPYSRPELVSRA